MVEQLQWVWEVKAANILKTQAQGVALFTHCFPTENVLYPQCAALS